MGEADKGAVHSTLKAIGLQLQNQLMPLAPRATQEQWEEDDDLNDATDSDDSATYPPPGTPSPPLPSRSATSRRDSELRPEDDTWCHLLYVFSQETTFHGVRYVGAKTRYIIRRLVWIIVVSLCVGVFLYYMIDRIAEFLQFRTTMAVEEYYVESMAFPSVTICNQNRIRLTAAADGGWYDVLGVINTDPRVDKELRLCEGDEFSCANKQCIANTKRCDSFPDCGDGSDERGCDPCPMLQFQLDNDTSYLPEFLLHAAGMYALLHTSVIPKLESLYLYRIENPDQEFYLLRNEELLQWELLSGLNAEAFAAPLAYSSYYNTSGSTADIPTNWTWWRLEGGGTAGEGEGAAYINLTCYDGDTFVASSGELSSELLGLNLADIYLNGSHQAKDFIKACTWKKNRCTIGDFIVRGTDLGICYTFNGTNLTAEQSGPGYGLQLSLNIEQYEYTKDMETGVGIKVMLHEPEDEPEMEKAFSISPGLYTMVSIEKTQLRNLDPPWGHCDERDLEYYEVYTENNCRVNSLTKDVNTACGCRDIYMPERMWGVNDTADVPICTVGQYEDCVKPIMFRHKADSSNACRKPCIEIMYVTSLSFASIATDDDAIQRRSQEAELHELISRRSHSREVAFRVQKDKLQQTLRVCHVMALHTLELEWYLESMSGAVDVLLRDVKQLGQAARSDCQTFGIIQKGMSSSLHNALQSMRRYGDMFYSRLLGNLHNMKYMLTSQTANYSASENNYVRVEPRELELSQQDVNLVLNDITFNLGPTMDVNIQSPRATVKGGNFTVMLQDETLWEMGSQRWTRFVGLRTTYISLMSAIDTLSGEFYTRLQEDIASLPQSLYRFNRQYKALLEDNSRGLCEWCMTDEPITLIDAISNKTETFLYGELNTELFQISSGVRSVYNSYMMDNSTKSRRATIAKMDNLILQAQLLYSTLDDTLVQAVSNATQAVDSLFRSMSPKCDTEFNYLFDDQHHQRRQFSIKMNETIGYTKKERRRFETLRDKYLEHQLTLTKLDALYDFEELMAFLNTDVRSIAASISSMAVLVHKYEYRAEDVINWIRAQSSQQYVIDNSIYLQGIRDRSMLDSNNSVYVSHDADTSVSDNNTASNDTSSDADVAPRELTAEELAAEVWRKFYKRLDAFTTDLEAHRQRLKDSVRESSHYLSEFIKGNQINEAFFRKNMVQVDVFYKTLANKTVVQQKAYTYPMLLGEIGGLYGLLLGASVLTLFEFIDFWVYNGAIKCQARHRRGKRKRKQRKKQNGQRQQATYTTGNHVKV